MEIVEANLPCCSNNSNLCLSIASSFVSSIAYASRSTVNPSRTTSRLSIFAFNLLISSSRDSMVFNDLDGLVNPKTEPGLIPREPVNNKMNETRGNYVVAVVFNCWLLCCCNVVVML